MIELNSLSVKVIWIALAVLLPNPLSADETKTVTEQHVIFYTTCGYIEGHHWIIPMRLWVREKANEIRRLAAKGARRIIRKRAGLEHLDDTQKRIFMSRAEDFVADSQSREVVVFEFENDPDNEPFHLTDMQGRSIKTDHNGLAHGTLTLSDHKAKRLLDAQGSRSGWLTYRAVSENHAGTGNVRLIQPAGVSVISDIDDTIKVTNIPAGEPEVLRNTFFREFVPAPCMAEMYRAFDRNVAFHYVSGGPWQLYESLANFMFSDSVGFPWGSFHMKNVRTNPFESESYQDLWKLVRDGSKRTTFQQKLEQISTIINRYSGRKFILIGDSGEQDPEVFQAIKARFPGQIIEVRIRDVINDQVNNPGRVDTIRIIPPVFSDADTCRDYLQDHTF